MHAIDLGVHKKILQRIWMNKTKVMKLTEQNKFSLDSNHIAMRCHIPKEFCRKPRTLRDLPRYKASESRQIILYTGIVLFKNILHRDLYEHYLLLHGAYRLISCPKNCTKNLGCVRDMLDEFVAKFGDFYGENSLSFNVHILLHLADCVELYGNVDNFSAYQYKNYLQILKKDCRKANKILQQLSNSSKERGILKTKKNIGLGNSYGERVRPNANSIKLYKSYEFDMFFLSGSKPDNLCCIRPFIPFKIKYFFKDEDEREYVIGRKYLEILNFFDEPYESIPTLGICYAKMLSEEEETVEIEQILFKMMSIPHEAGVVCIPILHQCL